VATTTAEASSGWTNAGDRPPGLFPWSVYALSRVIPVIAFSTTICNQHHDRLVSGLKWYCRECLDRKREH
jgi:hypothetical protein